MTQDDAMDCWTTTATAASSIAASKKRFRCGMQCHFPLSHYRDGNATNAADILLLGHDYFMDEDESVWVWGWGWVFLLTLDTTAY